VRVVVDRDLCQGHGVCESEVPDVFSVSKDGVLTILEDCVPEQSRAAVGLAISYCPTHALHLEEVD
jgi:ferredoxin